MNTVKIRLLTDRGHYIWLTINYFTKRFGGGVDNFYLTDHACWATAVPLKEARRWMREAKCLAATDGDVIEKAEYVCAGKPTTLSALGLKRGK
jgi:hypothetical protein